MDNSEFIKILDKRGVRYKTTPDGLSVGGDLYFKGTNIAALPDGLNVGGYLYLEGTNITALPDGLSVGGSLYLRDTNIAALPDRLSVGGSLYLEGKNITALPDGLSVGGSLYLRGTNIEALPDRLSVFRVFFEGKLGEYEFKIVDGWPCVSLSQKKIGGITLEKVRVAEFENGKLIGRIIYIASDGHYNAHGKTAVKAIDDLNFKKQERDIFYYKGMSLNTSKSPLEWSYVYRHVTGACQLGTEMFMDGQDLKDSYTLSEILELTKGQYGASRFAEVVA